MGRFKVLLADEPLDGLDPPSREVLFELLAETRASGAAIVVSTHRPDVIAAAGRCVAIRDGRLAYDGDPDPKVLGGDLRPQRARAGLSRGAGLCLFGGLTGGAVQRLDRLNGA